MAMTVNEQMKEFTERLRRARIHFSVSSVRDGYTMVSIAVPGERWEIEFSVSSEVEVEVFRSDGSIHGPDELDRLFRDHSDELPNPPR